MYSKYVFLGAGNVIYSSKSRTALTKEHELRDWQQEVLTSTVVKGTTWIYDIMKTIETSEMPFKYKVSSRSYK